MNIKPWQIFVFALVPLALVFAGVIGGSIHGLDSAKEQFPTVTAPPPSGSPVPGASPVAGTLLTISAQNLKFDKSSLTAPPNTQVTIRMTNNDAGVLHNIAVYRARDATQALAPGSTGLAPFPGPGTQSISFTTLGAGNYFFRCEVHPDTMTGSFIVR